MATALRRYAAGAAAPPDAGPLLDEAFGPESR
jgi:hypothetical protein